MSFVISGLPKEPFSRLFDLDDEGLARVGARRYVADAKPGFPCRVSLEDAEPGERVILVHYEHQPADTPFRASHAIYVRESAERAATYIDEVPEALRTRTLSVRAFDASGMLLDADLIDGANLGASAERLLAMPTVAYLHAHYAKFGCFAARVDRV